ncbi:MAG: SusD/RagB family nutrient-binding outer membrane lipoprotein [Bacteroidota bacterium]
MKKLLSIYIILFIFTACGDLLDRNEDPKRATQAPAATLFSNAQKNLVDIMTTPNVNSNIFRLLAQQWTETTYTDESRFDLSTRNIPQNFWNALYRDVLGDLKEAKTAIENADPTFTDPVVNQNQWAITEVVEVYTYFVLVSTFGNIPYSEAIDVENVFPRYEDAKTIHYDLIARLDQTLTQLDPAGESFGEADLIYGGDVEKWIKFNNTLKLKLGMMIADVDPTTARTVVEQAAPNVINSNDDNAVFSYLDAPPNTNPIWVNLVQSGRKDFVAANTLVDVMNTLEDPRRDKYFTTITEFEDDGETPKGTVFIGGIYGSSNNYASFSKPADAITAPSFEALLMDYSETEFFLAEAAERGMNVGGTAQEHYNNAITASITYWGGSEDEAAEYLANPAVAYATAEGDFRQKIGVQKWIALFNRGFEAWTEWRRLDYPALTMPEDPIADMPIRYTYPVNEQNLNTQNYNEAAAAIGGDLVTTPLFWDVTPSIIN